MYAKNGISLMPKANPNMLAASAIGDSLVELAVEAIGSFGIDDAMS